MTNGEFDEMKKFSQVWLDMLGRMGTLFGRITVGDPPPEGARQLRGADFKAMAHQVEEFMRSETFLLGMKEALESGLKFQKQYQTALAEFRHATEGVAATDVDALMRMLHQLESRVLDRLEDMEQRIEDLRQKLEPRKEETLAEGERPS